MLFFISFCCFLCVQTSLSPFLTWFLLLAALSESIYYQLTSGAPFFGEIISDCWQEIFTFCLSQLDGFPGRVFLQNLQNVILFSHLVVRTWVLLFSVGRATAFIYAQLSEGFNQLVVWIVATPWNVFFFSHSVADLLCVWDRCPAAWPSFRVWHVALGLFDYWGFLSIIGSLLLTVVVFWYYINKS